MSIVSNSARLRTEKDFNPPAGNLHKQQPEAGSSHCHMCQQNRRSGSDEGLQGLFRIMNKEKRRRVAILIEFHLEVKTICNFISRSALQFSLMSTNHRPSNAARNEIKRNHLTSTSPSRMCNYSDANTKHKESD